MLPFHIEKRCTLIERMKKFDSDVVSMAEIVARFIQRWTGVTNFHIARIFILIRAIQEIERHGYNFSDIGFSFFGIIAGGFILFQAETMSKLTGASMANPFRYQPIFIIIRMIDYFFLLSSIITFITLGVLDLETSQSFKEIMRDFVNCVLHLMISCSPLPPGISKVSEWLSSFSFGKEVQVGASS